MVINRRENDQRGDHRKKSEFDITSFSNAVIINMLQV